MKKLLTIISAIFIANAVCGQITSSRGNSFCEGNATTLTLTGGSGDNYVWTVQYGSAVDTLDGSGSSVTVVPHFFGNVIYRVYSEGSQSPLSTCLLTVKDCCSNVSDFAISKVCAPLNIDGNDSELEWSVSQWINVDKVSLNTAIKNPAGKWRMLYDDENIYFYIVVYDDSPAYNSFWTAADDNEGDGYKGDAAEIYLDAGNVCAGKPLQIGLTYPSSGIVPGKYNNQECNTTSFIGYEAKIKPWDSTTKSWAMEVKFPAADNGVNLNSSDFVRVEVGICQSNSTSGESVRGSLMHTWTSDAEMYLHLNNLHSVSLVDCASTRASDMTACNGDSIQLSTSIKSATAGVDASTAYTWQLCLSGCSDNSVGSTNWENVEAATEGDIFVTPVFDDDTREVYYRAVYNNEIAACPVKISLLGHISRTRRDSICENETYNFYGQTLREAGTYTANVRSQTSGCDSIITLILTVIPLKTETREDTICFGETYNFYGQTLNETDTYIANVPSSSTGCDSIITLNLTVLSIENDVEQKCCYYGLIEQNWNDVIAVLNEKYNNGGTGNDSGYKFTAFQWYKNGIVIAGETKSYIYLSEGLDTTAQYSVLLTHESGRQMASCAMIPRVIPDRNPYPQIIQSNGIIRLKPLQAGTLKVFSITGILIGSQQFGAETSEIEIPLKNGIYIIQIIFNDGTKEIFKIAI